MAQVHQTPAEASNLQSSESKVVSKSALKTCHVENVHYIVRCNPDFLVPVPPQPVLLDLCTMSVLHGTSAPSPEISQSSAEQKWCKFIVTKCSLARQESMMQRKSRFRQLCPLTVHTSILFLLFPADFITHDTCTYDKVKFTYILMNSIGMEA